jgi:hypothetical protein
MGALTPKEKDTLRRAGFLPREIKDFDTAKAIDGTTQDLNFAAENFQAMIRNRINLIKRLRAKDWTPQRIANLIGSYYSEKHRSKRSSFDLLQVETSIAAKGKSETDNSVARRLLKLSRVQATFGANYTKSLPNKSQVMPRNVPRRPEY